MSSFSSKFINGFQNNEYKKLMDLYLSFFSLLFPVYHMMLKYYIYSFYKELFFLILEYLNLIIFLFSEPVSKLYNFFLEYNSFY